MKRRDFIRNTLMAGTVLQFPHFWIKDSHAQANRYRLTLLQTNDTHSRIEPFPKDAGRNGGMGGIARRASLVERIRSQNPYTLLVDAGDAFQGTPYFNFYKGKVEYETMSQCGYDASTIGNHEFDNGVEALADALQYADFSMLNCNYVLADTPLTQKVRTMIVKQVGPIKVGITGVGIDFSDLVIPANHKGVSYQAPFKPLQSVVDYFRKDLGCQLVVVLSHLGYKPYRGKPGDTDLAYEVDGVDWIVGGHSHTFMDEPEVIVSKGGHTTRILQVGWAGILLGRTDFIFEKESLVSVNNRNVPIDDRIPEATSVQAMVS